MGKPADLKEKPLPPVEAKRVQQQTGAEPRETDSKEK